MKVNNHFDYSNYCAPQQIERDFNNLIGLIDGIAADNVLNEKEIAGIANWMLSTKQYENKSPYKDLIAILSASISDFILDEDERANIKWFCQRYITNNSYLDIITHGIQKLHGVLDGISLDNEINVTEIEFLNNWLNENSFLNNSYPYDAVSFIVNKIIEDGDITNDELTDLLNFCKLFKQSRLSEDHTTKDLVEQLIVDIFDPVHDFAIEDKKICITGASKIYKRDDIKTIIINKGGKVVGAVSNSIDYLIVCEERNVCWAYSMYGRKVEMAIKLKQSGAKLTIVHAEDLYKHII